MSNMILTTHAHPQMSPKAAAEILRQRWPAAFPNDAASVRPLANSAVHGIADAMGWSMRFTRKVLRRWVESGPYCRAVLSQAVRIGLDGRPSAERIDHAAKEDARRTLRRRSAAQAARAKDAAERARAARLLLDAHPVGAVLEGGERALVLSCLDAHPQRARKIGTGVTDILIRRNKGAPCFAVRRVDGTVETFGLQKVVQRSLRDAGRMRSARAG